MANNSERPPSSPPAGISGDVIILLVFLGIGTILFVSFAMGFVVRGQGTATSTSALSAAGTEYGSTVTPTPSAMETGTGTPTSLFITGTVTPPISSMPSLTSMVQAKTNTPVKSGTSVYVYKSSTPSPVKTKRPTNTNAPVRTSTRTNTPTATATSTATPTITPVTGCVTGEPGTGLPVTGNTWIESNEPILNHGSDTLLSLRADNNSDRRVLLKFDLSSLSGLPIADAKLYFYINSTSGATISLYGISRYWKEEQATWRLAETNGETNTAWTNEGGDYNAVPLISVVKTSDAACRVQLDITKLFKDWPTPGAENGVILIAAGTPGDISISSSRATAYPPILLLVTITPTATVTSTTTLTPTSTSTTHPTVTATVTGTLTSTPTPTQTVTVTLTPTSTLTVTLAPTSTPTVTETPTP